MSVSASDDGKKSAFTERGTGDELIVMLHASATGPHALSRLAEYLQDDTRRLIIPAFAGYGAAPHPSSEQSASLGQGSASNARISANCRIAQDALQHRPAARRVLFGHSMGGLVALLVALKAELSGSPLDALVLYEPILIDLLDDSQPGQVAARAWDRAVIDHLQAAVTRGDPEAGVRHFVEAWNETPWGDLPEPARQHLVANAPNLVIETEAVSTQPLDHAALRASETPTLIIGGTRSPELIGYTNVNTASMLASARLVTMPDCGHMAPLLQPRAVAATINEFLRSLPQEPTTR